MDIREMDENEIIEELANRGIDVRTIKDYTSKELQDEIDRRDNEREIEIQARHDAEMAQEGE